MRPSFNRVTWAAKEWRRRPARTFLSVFAVALATGVFAAVLAFHRGYQRGMKAELERLGAHILVVPKGCPYDAASIALHGANWPCYLPARYLDEVRAVGFVSTAAPALMSAFNQPDGQSEVYVGITPDMSKLRPGWRMDGRFPSTTNEVLAGADAARRHGWKPGMSVVLTNLGATRWHVAGVLEPTASAEDRFIFLPLESAQHAMNRKRELTHMLVRLKEPGDLDRAVRELRGCNAGMDMNVVPLTHLFHTVESLLNSTRLWLVCVALVALLGATAGVTNALLMSVSERSREIGVFRAVGADRTDVALLLWTEAILVSFVGGMAGTAGALALARPLESWLRTQLPFTPVDPLIQNEAWLWWVCLAGSLVLGGVGALLPALRASSLPPAIAMRAPKGTW